MRRAQQIQLTEEERKGLKKLVSTGTNQARVLTRARIVLMAAKGEGNQQIADALGVAGVPLSASRLASKRKG